MNWIKRIFSKKVEKQCAIDLVSYCFKDGEEASYFDGYGYYDVTVVGTWQDVATIEYEDGYKLNTNIKNLSKNCS